MLMHQPTEMCVCGTVYTYKHSTRWRLHMTRQDHLMPLHEDVKGTGIGLHVVAYRAIPVLAGNEIPVRPPRSQELSRVDKYCEFLRNKTLRCTLSSLSFRAICSHVAARQAKK